MGKTDKQRRKEALGQVQVLLAAIQGKPEREITVKSNEDGELFVRLKNDSSFYRTG